MRNTKISNLAAENAINAFCALFDEGAVLELWSGTIPESCLQPDASDGDKLATLQFNSDAFNAAGAVIPRRAYARTIAPDLSADVDGIATHFRCKDALGSVLLQGTAGVAADTPNLVLDDAFIIRGNGVVCSSFWVGMV